MISVLQYMYLKSNCISNILTTFVFTILFLVKILYICVMYIPNMKHVHIVLITPNCAIFYNVVVENFTCNILFYFMKIYRYTYI